MNKRRIFLVAVALGVVLGAGIALTRAGRSEKGGERPMSNVQSPTSNVVAVVDKGQKTEDKGVVTNAVKVAVATNVAVNVQPPKLPNPQTSKPPKPITTYAPNVPKARQVLLANRRIVIEKGRSFPKKFCQAQTPTSRGTAPYIVISEIPVSRDVRIQAVADGAKVIGFLPNNALLVEADAAALKNLEDDAMFLAAVEYEPTDKIQRALGKAMVGDEAKGEGEGEFLTQRHRDTEGSAKRIEATVVLLNEKDRETVSAFVTANGGKMIRGMPTKGKAISVEIPSAFVTDLAKKAEVKWIEKHGRMRVQNDFTVLPSCMNVTPVWNLHGLDGAGEVVSIADTGIDTGKIGTLHADFYEKVVDIFDLSGYETPWDAYGHGTHTAGCLVGTGANSDGTYRGVAKGARIYVMAGGNGTNSDIIEFAVATYADVFAPFDLKYDTYIQSDSWGGNCHGEYTEWCWGLDASAWMYPELLVVMANGNDGSAARTVNEPAAAKNCLAVGNTYSGYGNSDPTKIYTDSSRGPCADGRIKPDVAAPGQHIASCRSTRSVNVHDGICTNANYLYMSGTSMATPHVAGAAAIVRQWLRRDMGFDNGANKPSGALMKAILTGGANGGDIPDNDFGWGRVDLEASIFPTNGVAVYLKDWLPFKQGTNFVFHVTTTNTAAFRAQLVWIDYPGEEGTGPTIVNDLDLKVSSFLGGTYYGNGGSTPDEINTVESVRIESASPATYTVTVSCPTIKVAYDDDDMELGRGGAAAIYIRGAFDPKKVIEGDMPFMFYLTQHP